MVYIISDNGEGKPRKIDLYDKDGKPFTSHVGGITVYGDYAYIADGKGFSLFELADIFDTDDKATMLDIVTELMKPGRDIREGLPKPVLRKDVMGIADLKVGMELTGTVRNVVDFGVFIDIGVHQDGLAHISELTDKYIRHPSEVLKVGQVVQVRVKEVDVKKNRIGLSMKKLQKNT